MRRFYPTLYLLVLLLPGGCRIERTPNEYIDRVETPEEELQAATEELVDRLLSTAPSLQRRSRSDVTAALAPHVELNGIGPAGEVVSGTDDLIRALEEQTAGNRVAMDDLKVEVDVGNDVAWFRSVLTLTDQENVTRRMPFTGVFLHHDGEWRLRQGNVALPVSPPADSAAVAG